MLKRWSSFVSVLVLVTLFIAVPVAAADKTKPSIVKAETVDADGDQRVDAVRLTYSEKIRHRLDTDGKYPFKVATYRVRKVGSAAGSLKLTIFVKEKGSTDTGARPTVTYVKTSSKPVTDRAGNQGKAQSFSKTLPLHRTGPVMIGARAVDVDLNDRMDGIEVTYDEPIFHPADSDGSYPFAVGGYSVKGVGAVSNSSQLLVLVAEQAEADLAGRPPITYSATSSAPVIDFAKNPAKTQSFSGTIPIHHTGPVITAAETLDRDVNGLVDGLGIAYDEPVDHVADTDGSYPFTVEGYEISAVGEAIQVDTLTIDLVEGSDPDNFKRPAVTYAHTTEQPVTDFALNEAEDQTFGATLPLDREAPRIEAAVAVDADLDDQMDGIVLEYSEEVVHGVDVDGFYPFVVEGYEIEQIGPMTDARHLSIVLTEAGAPDIGAKPSVAYAKTGDDAVTDKAGNQARGQVFGATVPLDVDEDGYTSVGGDCGPTEATVYPGAPDLPDLNFVDQNCDGIDGDEAKAVFLDRIFGSDGNDGSRELPVATLARAMELAQGQPLRDVYVAVTEYAYTGPLPPYSGPLALADGVSLFGGYSDSFASRSADAITLIEGTPEGAVADGDTGVTLQLLSLKGVPSVGHRSAYGLRAVNGSSVALQKVRVEGAGALAGTAGTSGSSGSYGAGYGGASGGSGGYGYGGGYNGGTGGGPNGGSPGYGGSYSYAGGTGGGAGSGQPGNAGSGGTASMGTGGYWSLDTGRGYTGGGGYPGSGGGGGGGGGGWVSSYSCNCGPFYGCDTCYTYYAGGSGGSGGNGGGGGFGGQGGSGGGGSFGLYVINSVVTVADCDVISGAGGTGGSGGGGGGGGGGQSGQPGYVPGNAPYGGTGGHGGGGGAGGPGGGGAGGPSVAAFLAGSATITADEASSLVAGPGGAGGTSPAGPSYKGANGISAARWPAS